MFSRRMRRRTRVEMASAVRGRVMARAVQAGVGRSGVEQGNGDGGP